MAKSHIIEPIYESIPKFNLIYNQEKKLNKKASTGIILKSNADDTEPGEQSLGTRSAKWSNQQHNISKQHQIR